MTTTENHQILGLDSRATHEQIREARRALSLVHHPDRGGDPETMALINRNRPSALLLSRQNLPYAPKNQADLITRGAYVLADRATWLNFKNRADLAILVEGDNRLFNQYGVMVVNPAKHAHVKLADAQKFVDWITSAAGQGVIADYKIGRAVVLPERGQVRTLKY